MSHESPRPVRGPLTLVGRQSYVVPRVIAYIVLSIGLQPMTWRLAEEWRASMNPREMEQTLFLACIALAVLMVSAAVLLLARGLTLWRHLTLWLALLLLAGITWMALLDRFALGLPLDRVLRELTAQSTGLALYLWPAVVLGPLLLTRLVRATPHHDGPPVWSLAPRQMRPTHRLHWLALAVVLGPLNPGALLAFLAPVPLPDVAVQAAWPWLVPLPAALAAAVTLVLLRRLRTPSPSDLLTCVLLGWLVAILVAPVLVWCLARSGLAGDALAAGAPAALAQWMFVVVPVAAVAVALPAALAGTAILLAASRPAFSRSGRSSPAPDRAHPAP